MQFTNGTKETTRGPWFVGSEHEPSTEDRERYGQGKPDYDYDAEGWPYFVGIQRTGMGENDYHVACSIQDLENARLIAAAPDLLAALKSAISSRWLSIDHDHNRTREAMDSRAQMIAAIDKATGDA